ncbi:N-acetyltransferase family protein [Euzebya sp.]|uniref:GNAT family N-acetyltransferase n=1 Tax=Euzebya sp. TaxID=1971409 RepID=UPI003513B61B
MPDAPAPLSTSAGLFAGSAAPRLDLATARGQVLVRPVSPLDADRVDAFVAGLSAASRFRRFNTGVHRLSPSQLAAIVDVDHRGRETLVGVAGRRVVGLVQSIELPADPTAVDIAVVVDDAWQGHGLGRLLLQAIAAAAQATGHGTALVMVQADNGAVLHLIRSSGLPTASQRQGASVDITIQL